MTARRNGQTGDIERELRMGVGVKKVTHDQNGSWAGGSFSLSRNHSTYPNIVTHACAWNTPTADGELTKSIEKMPFQSRIPKHQLNPHGSPQRAAAGRETPQRPPL
eukprot:scaffold538_cov127-Alexandrium_tamarense.AAC.3